MLRSPFLKTTTQICFFVFKIFCISVPHHRANQVLQVLYQTIHALWFHIAINNIKQQNKKSPTFRTNLMQSLSAVLPVLTERLPQTGCCANTRFVQTPNTPGLLNRATLRLTLIDASSLGGDGKQTAVSPFTRHPQRKLLCHWKKKKLWLLVFCAGDRRHSSW